jgi:hypothetical protein
LVVPPVGTVGVGEAVVIVLDEVADVRLVPHHPPATRPGWRACGARRDGVVDRDEFSQERNDMATLLLQGSLRY